MDDDASRKRDLPDADDPAASPSKRPKLAQVNHQNEDKNDDEGDDILAWLTLDEDTMSQLLDLLDHSPTSSAAPSPLSAAASTPAPAEACSGGTTTASFCRVRFVEYPYNARLEVIRSSSSFVTINVNEESCGSSFSEIESSMMASIDRGGAWVAPAAAVAGMEEKGVWSSGSGVPSGGAGGLSAELKCSVGGGNAGDGDGDDDVLALLLGEEGGGF